MILNANFYRRMLSILCLIVLPCRIFSETVVLYRFESGKPDRDFEEILYLTMGVELAKAGFSSTKIPDDEDLVLETEYLLQERTVEVHFLLYDAHRPGTILAEQNGTFSLVTIILDTGSKPPSCIQGRTVEGLYQ
jgi:hypothetical protein